MDLLNIYGKKKKLESPTKIQFVFGGPKITFWGIESSTTYRVGGDDVLVIDGRDYDYLLSLSKHGRNYFSEYVDFEELKEEEPIVELNNQFVVIKGIGNSLNDKIHSLDVHNLEELYDKGVEWIANLPKVSEDKANEIYEQLEELLTGE